jgi:hypothetical protein
MMEKSLGQVRCAMKRCLGLLWGMLALLFVTGCADPNPAQLQTPQSAGALQEGAQTVQGVVLSGGDTTPPGLMDAPRTFVYQVKLEDGQTIAVSFTSYPPSPAFAGGPPYRLTIQTSEIQPGNYIIAHGTYHLDTQTLVVAEEGDFVEVYAEKPQKN